MFEENDDVQRGHPAYFLLFLKFLFLSYKPPKTRITGKTPANIHHVEIFYHKRNQNAIGETKKIEFFFFVTNSPLSRLDFHARVWYHNVCSSTHTEGYQSGDAAERCR